LMPVNTGGQAVHTLRGLLMDLYYNFVIMNII
jgi:hypothetical protein